MPAVYLALETQFESGWPVPSATLDVSEYLRHAGILSVQSHTFGDRKFCITNVRSGSQYNTC